MSVVEQLKNLFSKKEHDSEMDSRLSLGMPDAGPDPMVTMQMPDSASQASATEVRMDSRKEAAKDLTSGLQTLDKEAEAQVAQVVGAANANVKGILGRFKIHL